MRKPKRPPAPTPHRKTTLLAVVAAVASALSSSSTGYLAQGQHQRDELADRRITALEQQVATLREQQAGVQADVRWLVLYHGGKPASLAPGEPSPAVAVDHVR